jgi:hypothetical protein
VTAKLAETSVSGEFCGNLLIHDVSQAYIPFQLPSLNRVLEFLASLHFTSSFSSCGYLVELFNSPEKKDIS